MDGDDLPDGYAWRRPTHDDVDAVAAVLAADDLDDAGVIVLDADFLRAGWSRADLDLATDAWVVLDPTRVIVGYAHVTLEGENVAESWGVVHPAHRGRGIGTFLLDRIEGRVAEHPEPAAVRFRHAINASDAAIADMLRARDLREVRHFWHLQIDLEVGFDEGSAPAGIDVRSATPPDDLVTVHGVLQAAFAEDWGYQPDPLEAWLEEHTGFPGYDPELWLLASVDGEVAGALTASGRGERGWVDEVGVLPGHRGRGIGKALLRRSFATFASRGVREVLLNVDAENPTGATALYEGAGMRIVKRWDLWERGPTG
jgi:mycothiol synthase